MKRKPLISLLVLAVAAFFWAVGPSVSLSFLLRSPIVLFRELVSLMRPTSTLDSTGPNASIFTLRRPQLLLESAAMNSGGTGGARVAPRVTTAPTSVLNPAAVLNPVSPNLLPSSIINNPVPTAPLTPAIGTVLDLLPTITAPSVPSVPSVSVPDVPAVPSVTVPSVPSTPTVTVPSTPVTPSVSVPSTPTPSAPSVGAPPGGGTPSGGGAPGVGGIGIKLP